MTQAGNSKFQVMLMRRQCHFLFEPNRRMQRTGHGGLRLPRPAADA
jgi:hypothetical protein